MCFDLDVVFLFSLFRAVLFIVAVSFHERVEVEYEGLEIL